MDGSEADAAVRRLAKGKYVDATFDLGEDVAARAFIREAEALGLEATFCGDEPLSWVGSRPRPLFLKLSLAVLLGFGICVWSFVRWPHAVVTKSLTIVEGLVIVSWLASVDRRPRT
jgi:hypothetical protein